MMPCNLYDVDKLYEDPKTEEEYCKFGFATYKNAESFAFIANLIDGNIELFRKAAFPEVTNAAFACELYIKSLLLLMQNETVSGHHLDKLYSRITSKEIKKRIFLFTHAEDQQTFDRNLRNIGKAFEVCRYQNEYSGMTIELQFLILFMNALRKECTLVIKEIQNNKEK